MPRPRQAGTERLDLLLVERGLAATRTEARALVLAGQVFTGHSRVDKPGTRLPRDTPLSVRQGRRWVSRGGDKLEHALDRLRIDVSGLDAMDVGASTGGFTQVLLHSGATRVIALDVGRGQLDWSLRQDPRVIPRERINARHLDPAALDYSPALITLDVSFISLRLVLPAVVACLTDGGQVVALVKPQFEVGRGQVGSGGIVRDRALHREVLDGLVRFLGDRGWGIRGVTFATPRGAEGNREFFLWFEPSHPGLEPAEVETAIADAIAKAWESDA